MFRLIKEYLTSAIKMHNAAETAFNKANESHTKHIEYLDNLINHDLMRQERELLILDQQLINAKDERRSN